MRSAKPLRKTKEGRYATEGNRKTLRTGQGLRPRQVLMLQDRGYRYSERSRTSRGSISFPSRSTPVIGEKNELDQFGSLEVETAFVRGCSGTSSPRSRSTSVKKAAFRAVSGKLLQRFAVKLNCNALWRPSALQKLLLSTAVGTRHARNGEGN